MNRSLTHWLTSNEQVHYLEQDVPGLVDKPLDPQGATIWTDDALVAKGGLRALQSTRDLPKNPQQGDNFMVGDVHWMWMDGKWQSREGLYGH